MPRKGELSELVGYRAAHKRVKTQRGLANEHLCEHCGSQAQQWAYDKLDPEEIPLDTCGDLRGPYSLDPDHYLPLCGTCHQVFDNRPKGSCKHGHRLTEKNTIIDKRGWFSCRDCRAVNEKRYRLRNMEEVLDNG